MVQTRPPTGSSSAEQSRYDRRGDNPGARASCPHEVARRLCGQDARAPGWPDNDQELLLSMVPSVPDGITACLFDLDGVLTQTAKVHAAAWKEMFDAFLRERSMQTGESLRPFDIATD